MTATVTGLVTKVTRHGFTVNGNPRMRVELSTPSQGFDGLTTFRIRDNSSLVFAIENAEYRDVPHVFELNRAGSIVRDLGEWQ